jgi:predicted Zn-dependent protease
VSALAHAGVRRVFRFAHEAIHQDLIQESVTVTLKVIDGRRVGVASTDTLTPESLARCSRAALANARHSPAQPQRAPLPSRPANTTAVDYVRATTDVRPAECVGWLKDLFQLCRGAGAQLAGSLITGEDEWAVVNSAGVRCYAASTLAGAKLVTMYGTLSGFASGVHRDVRRLNLRGLLTRSLRQSLHRQTPAVLPLGAYEVILEPEAVAELVDWLGYTAFGAKSVEERTSCFAGRLGEPLMHPQVTIYDDGNDPHSLRLPFDVEGTPRQRVVLVDRGKAAGIVYDSSYGVRFNHPSTGHAVTPDDLDGPLPLHLAMAPGRTSQAAMIRACRKGLLIPRFHYVNGLLNPREALMTGLTREGTFLIERGKLTSPVATLRFTQSMLEAFRRVLGVSKERRLVADPSAGIGCALMPTVHLAAFQFTGRSGSE